MDTLFLFLPLFITYLLLTDLKSPANAWAGLTLSLAAVGGVYSVAEHFHAGIMEKFVNPDLIHIIYHIYVTILVKTPLCLFPVAFLLFAVYYCHWHKHQSQSKKQWVIPIIFFPAFTMLFIPLDPKDYLSLRQFLIITDLWALPYLTMVYILLYKSVVYNRRFATDHLLSIITIIVMSITYIALVYLLPLFHFPLFKINLQLLIIFFLLFFLLVAKYGFLGVKLSVRNIYLDHNLRTVDSEVSVFNYQIKDPLRQILTCALDIETTAENKKDLFAEKARTIFAAAAQVTQVTNQLHHYLDKITPQPRLFNLAELVGEAIASFQSQFKEKALDIVNNLPAELIIESDPFYLTEVLKHILQNALEATVPGDRIIINVTLSKREVTLVITDTGCGISPSERLQILKPFYTTKDRGSNFGLGLSYSYNVMQHLGGRLEIDSTEDNGTTVILKLPVGWRFP